MLDDNLEFRWKQQNYHDIRGVLQICQLFSVTSISNRRPRDHSWTRVRNPKEAVIYGVCSLTEIIPISLWIESFICLYSDDGRMYRRPLSIKYKNLCIYSEVTIIFNWEIYLVFLIRSILKLQGKQISHVNATFPVDCTWHQKAQLHLKGPAWYYKRLILSPRTQNKHHFWIIDIYIKNTSKKALVSAIKKLYVLGYIFSYRPNPVETFLFNSRNLLLGKVSRKLPDANLRPHLHCPSLCPSPPCPRLGTRCPPSGLLPVSYALAARALPVS